MTDEDLKTYRRNYYLKNKEDFLAKKKIYEKNNSKSIKDKQKTYREANKETLTVTKKIASKKYYESNKEKLQQYNKKYQKIRSESDPLFKLTQNIRANIRNSFKNNGLKKNNKTINILSCSFENFKLYLESKFEPWMNWDNYGKYNGQERFGWDIDHIIPSSSALNEGEVIKLNHYTNLQPLCSYINRNIKRGN